MRGPNFGALRPHRGITEKDIRMFRRSFTFLIAGGVLLCHSANAQCRGGTGTGTTTGTTTGAATASGLITPAGLAGTSRVLTGPGSLAYDTMLANMMVQQMAQQQQMLAMQQQKVKQEKLAHRRYRAEQTRAQVAESRARTRAALVAASGLAPKSTAANLVAYQPPRR